MRRWNENCNKGQKEPEKKKQGNGKNQGFFGFAPGKTDVVKEKNDDEVDDVIEHLGYSNDVVLSRSHIGNLRLVFRKFHERPRVRQPVFCPFP
jgi:hypothetical protein